MDGLLSKETKYNLPDQVKYWQFKSKDLNLYLCLSVKFLDYRIKFANKVKGLIHLMETDPDLLDRNLSLLSASIDLKELGLNIKYIDTVLNSIFMASIEEEKISPKYSNYVLLEYPIKTLKHLQEKASQYKIKSTASKNNFSNPEGHQELKSRKEGQAKITIEFNTSYIDSLLKALDLVIRFQESILIIARELSNKNTSK